MRNGDVCAAALHAHHQLLMQQAQEDADEEYLRLEQRQTAAIELWAEATMKQADAFQSIAQSIANLTSHATPIMDEITRQLYHPIS